MDKVSHLKEVAQIFFNLLKEHENKDINAFLLLKWLTPLFREIQAGNTHPPKTYEFRMAIGKDDDFYSPDKTIFCC